MFLQLQGFSNAANVVVLLSAMPLLGGALPASGVTNRIREQVRGQEPAKGHPR